MELLKVLNSKLDQVIKNQEAIIKSLQGKQEEKPRNKIQKAKMSLDAMALLSLPDQLRKTALAVHKLGRATTERIAEDTGRERDVENMYLNQLVRMGYLKMKKQAKDVYFHL